MVMFKIKIDLYGSSTVIVQCRYQSICVPKLYQVITLAGTFKGVSKPTSSVSCQYRHRISMNEGSA